MPKKNKAWLKEHLSDESFQVTQNKATEAPFSGKYNDFWEDGYYECICCQAKLFQSESKFNHGCGWPAFYQKGEKAQIDYLSDMSLGRERTEVLCHNCQAHLGHVFDDGPPPTHKRYCINSAAINFIKK